jgi:biopolymer transport protein ExbD
MKKLIPVLLIVVLVAAYCTTQSGNSPLNKKAQKVYVYTSIPPEKAIYKLYLNEDYIGEIPYIESTNKHRILSSALSVYLKKRNQVLVAKDKEESFYSSVSFNRTISKLNFGFAGYSKESSTDCISSLKKENGFTKSTIDKDIVLRLQ